MRGDFSAESIADRQIWAYLDGTAHYFRYEKFGKDYPGRLARINVPTVLGTLALAPFVQALSSSLGERAGKNAERGMRAVARKILRRELDSAGTGGDRIVPTVRESSADAARIQFDEDLSEEALLLLPTMDFAPLPRMGDHPPVVRWLSDGRWHAVTLRDDLIVDACWDPATASWQHASAPNEWGDAARRN
jgi:hypothetical protein